MQRASRLRSVQGFTLIELLTVIAIIAVLTAILFPLAGTARESARGSDCMSKLHQLYVSASTYRLDEGAFPPALLGYPEISDGLGGSTGVYFTGSGQVANVDRVINPFLYREQVKDVNVFHCPDNLVTGKAVVTIAHYTTTPPPNWPVGQSWIGKSLADYGCPTDAYGTIDCYVGGPYDKLPKYFYVWDSYDIGPVVNALQQPITMNGQQVYEKHYSPDWTGIRGAGDLPNQLKYSNPPDDKTLLAYCTWHCRTFKTGNAPAITLSGTARKVALKQMLDFSANAYNR